MIQKRERGGERNLLPVTDLIQRPEVEFYEISGVLPEKILEFSEKLSKVKITTTAITLDEFYPLDVYLPEWVNKDVGDFLSDNSIGPHLDHCISRVASALAATIDDQIGDAKEIVFSHADTILYANTEGKIGYLWLVINKTERSLMLQSEISFKVV
ncbi:hypothetical protein M5a_00207 [Klebsiella phage VLCpiM5a]|uniref:Uncharacterized protein n=1 Tax=Klebsiella phage vB_KpnM_KB57 TaxID=1719140 RepID=A0A0S1S1A7_9CAUD|nr:hypothetical protein KB57_014 [Klebsiella phage vB_KpnM_KB57]ALM02407.1 hypothetical protein KB57_014 [Klebsiella phage vB_KpnM_KB57]QKE60442.1 hypothetical protein KPP_1121 [Klebsiella phage KPP-1]UVX30082.1 hypothetical protein M5a_00207 [Klebsiella phage VLCpiM5a]DAT86125.1 MAG TPA: hypothetical protein [Caudoviricetes sp.]